MWIVKQFSDLKVDETFYGFSTNYQYRKTKIGEITHVSGKRLLKLNGNQYIDSNFKKYQTHPKVKVLVKAVVNNSIGPS